MNIEKKTLIILTPGFPSSESDSTCLPMQQYFIRSIKKMHPALDIVILSFQYPYFQKSYTWFNTTVISYSGRNKSGIRRLLLRRKIYRTLKDIHRSATIIGLLSFWLGECALTGSRFAARYGLLHYCWILGQDAKKENKYASRIDPAPAELIALSDFLQDEFEKNHGPRPRHVIPSGIEPVEFTYAEKGRDIDILAAGSLIPLKRYELFIDIVASVREQLPGIKVMLIGHGPEKDKLQKLIAAAGLQDTIVLTGELPHSTVLQLMQRAKVFLHPSSYEGLSGVCQEALSQGAHVISFCKAMKQEIDQWHIVHSKEGMKKKTLDIIKDPATVYISVIPFTMNDTVKRMMELY
jgi:glycosyltransferase involved in cell wall biosynthesis